MSELVIETQALRKEHPQRGGRTHVAVDALDLAVPAGTVHGLLGPDGSGKSTVIRMLLGLTRPTSGSVRLFGHTVPDDLATVMPRVGATVERPAFTRSFTGRRNLDLLARAAGVPADRVTSVLARVGLAERADTPYVRYTAGARQRLAIAAALLREPALLVLDEPTHRLDPAGVRDLWRLVREVAAGGTTVLLASHEIDEVQEVCGTVTILGAGRTVAAGSVVDLIGEARARTRVGTDDPDRAMRLLSEGGFTVLRDGDDLLVEGHEHPEEVSRVLAGHGIYVHELSAVRPDLESVFLQLTSGDEGRAAS